MESKTTIITFVVCLFLAGCAGTPRERFRALPDNSGYDKVQTGIAPIEGDTAAARQNAINNALREALIQHVRSSRLLKDFRLLEEVVRVSTDGFIEGYDVLEARNDGATYTVTVRARVRNESFRDLEKYAGYSLGLSFTGRKSAYKDLVMAELLEMGKGFFSLVDSGKGNDIIIETKTLKMTANKGVYKSWVSYSGGGYLVSWSGSGTVIGSQAEISLDTIVRNSIDGEGAVRTAAQRTAREILKDIVTELAGQRCQLTVNTESGKFEDFKKLTETLATAAGTESARLYTEFRIGKPSKIRLMSRVSAAELAGAIEAEQKWKITGITPFSVTLNLNKGGLR